MTKPYNSLEVSAKIADLCNEFGYFVNNTKIQKLLYCCYGTFLAIFDERLCDEHPRAWQYGPVFPKVFKYFHDKKALTGIDTKQLENMPEDRQEWLTDTVFMFGKFSAVPLSEWTQLPNSPWDTVVNEIGQLNDFIPDDIIKDYFQNYVIK